MARKVLMIGAQGVLGTFMARAFRDAGWQVTRGGRRPETAADFTLVDLDRFRPVRGYITARH
jgi:NAD(P)-dependent dehydrogenase (short-subunit alcohol dehydrogenase family)